MYYFFFLILALFANGFLRNKEYTKLIGSSNFNSLKINNEKTEDNLNDSFFIPVKSKVDVINNKFDKEKSNDNEKIKNIKIDERQYVGFIENCTINSCVKPENKDTDILHENEINNLAKEEDKTMNKKKEKEGNEVNDDNYNKKENNENKERNDIHKEKSEFNEKNDIKINKDEKEKKSLNNIETNEKNLNKEITEVGSNKNYEKKEVKHDEKENKEKHKDGSAITENTRSEDKLNLEKKDDHLDEEKEDLEENDEEEKDVDENDEEKDKGDEEKDEEDEKEDENEDDIDEGEKESEKRKEGKNNIIKEKEIGKDKNEDDKKNIKENEKGNENQNKEERDKNKIKDNTKDLEKDKEEKKEEKEKKKEENKKEEKEKKKEEKKKEEKEETDEGKEKDEEKEVEARKENENEKEDVDENEKEEEEENEEENEKEEEEEEEDEKEEEEEDNHNNGEDIKKNNENHENHEMKKVNEDVTLTKSYIDINENSDIKNNFKIEQSEVKNEDNEVTKNIKDNENIHEKKDENNHITSPNISEQPQNNTNKERFKKKKNFESNMFIIDKKMQKNLKNVDGILKDLNSKLNYHKDLKNRELKLKFEAMSRIKQYDMFNDLIKKSVEILTLRLMKINEDLHKLKQSSEIALQKYITEKGDDLIKFSNLPKYDKYNEEGIIERSKTNKSESNGHLFCPINCDKESCYNKPDHPTQCYKLEQSGNHIKRICEPFANSHNATCKKDFNHCAIAAPERNRIYSVFIYDEHQDIPQFITIKGYNLHECLQFLVVNKNSVCLPEFVERNIIESSEILMEPVLTKLLKDEVVFENIKINKEGEYNICLAQFYHTEEKEDLLAENSANKNKKKKKNEIKILGVDSVGTLYVLPFPSKKKIKD
ncbi:rhoptry neck protein 6, putative [Plasmodium gallinaceum]|uniref:Rhoptry neck protein 6, putative n=1 Tax=Plasmodium gallinaceum TaxID=5849 RepID=A0A1J1GSR6_PLAGA|nr:rhoptry neck protein 6, putative [Plasmodium gallinaceum]CRG94352.1 rhoptry neck protein 6, putative [Plasmodium gallinaceum]